MAFGVELVLNVAAAYQLLLRIEHRELGVHYFFDHLCFNLFELSDFFDQLIIQGCTSFNHFLRVIPLLFQHKLTVLCLFLSAFIFLALNQHNLKLLLADILQRIFISFYDGLNRLRSHLICQLCFFNVDLLSLLFQLELMAFSLAVRSEPSQHDSVQFLLLPHHAVFDGEFQ